MKKLNIFRYYLSAKIINFLFVDVFVAQLFNKKGESIDPPLYVYELKSQLESKDLILSLLY